MADAMKKFRFGLKDLDTALIPTSILRGVRRDLKNLESIGYEVPLGKELKAYAEATLIELGRLACYGLVAKLIYDHLG